MKKFTLILAALITSITMAGCTPFACKPCKSHERLEDAFINEGMPQRHHAKQGRKGRARASTRVERVLRRSERSSKHRKDLIRFRSLLKGSQPQEKSKKKGSMPSMRKRRLENRKKVQKHKGPVDIVPLRKDCKLCKA